eukprot:2450770-Prymnesium_polylepis.1
MENAQPSRLLIHHFLVTPHPTATPAQPRKSTTSSALQLTEMGSAAHKRAAPRVGWEHQMGALRHAGGAGTRRCASVRQAVRRGTDRANARGGGARGPPRSSAFFHSCQWKSFDQRLRPSALSAFVTGACRARTPMRERPVRCSCIGARGATIRRLAILQGRACLHRSEEAEGAQEGKVDGDEDVEVLLFDELDHPVQPKEHARADDRKAHRIALRDGFDLRTVTASDGPTRATPQTSAAGRAQRCVPATLLEPFATRSGRAGSRSTQVAAPL